MHPSPSSSPRLVLGQITDLHARQHLPGSCPANRRRSREAFKLLGEALETLKNQGAEHVAITGDLLDVPQCVLAPDNRFRYPTEAWRNLARRDYEAMKQILDHAGLPYTVLPGNHDDELTFYQVFGTGPTVLDLPQGYRLLRFDDREWAGHVPRRFDRERRRWLDALRAEDSPPQIHLQHYVITPALNEVYPHTYYEGEDLAERTGASGRVVLSLSGHYHTGTDLHRRGRTLFTVGPCFAQAPHPCRIYRLDGEQVTLETHELRPGPPALKPAVFLDRDGVLTGEEAWRSGPDRVDVIPGTGEAVRRLRAAGRGVAVISNQSTVGHGYLPREVVEANNEQMCALLIEQAGSPEAQPDGMYFSVGAGERAVHPDLRDRSLTKPSPALLHQACEELHLDPCGAWMVGDRAADLETAAAFGARAILVRTGHGRKTLDELENRMVEKLLVVDHLAEAAACILENTP